MDDNEYARAALRSLGVSHAGYASGGFVKGSSYGTPSVVEVPKDEINPEHYSYPDGAEVIDITRHMDFLTGNAVKYLARAGRKGDRLTDLLKAQKYVAWAIEDEEN